MSQNDSEQMELVLQTLPVFVVSLSISLASLRNQSAYGLPIFWKRLSFMPFPATGIQTGGFRLSTGLLLTLDSAQVVATFLRLQILQWCHTLRCLAKEPVFLPSNF